jgi:hypothetical protein
MRKLKLTVDALRVETFDPDAAITRAAGTVRANDSDEPPNTDPHLNTCDVLSCGGTCWLTHNVCGTCGEPTSVDPCG